MLTTLAVVEVCPDLDHLRPGSPLAGIARRQFGGKTLLEWVVRRVSEATRLSGIVVLAGDDRLSHGLVENCPPDVRVFHAREHDSLGRLAAVARNFDCDGLVRLNVCHPFVDPELIDRLITAASTTPGCDYASYCLSDGRHVMQSKLGVFAEWCSNKAILRADQMAKGSERADATGFLYSHPEHFNLKLLAAPPQLDRDDVRLAIQDEEDWENVQMILDAIGPESLDWHLITALLDRQPSLRQRMALLNQETAK